MGIGLLAVAQAGSPAVRYGGVGTKACAEVHEEQQDEGQGASHGHDGPPLKAETRVSAVGHRSQHGESSYRDAQGVHRLILLQ